MKPLLLFILFFTSFLYSIEKIQPIVYTSDTHVSLPEGRFKYTTDKYKKFIKQNAIKNNLFFINGDFIDNAYFQNNKVVGGNKKYQIKETKYFLNLTKKLTGHYKNKLILNYGTGHDFGDLLLSETLTEQMHIGKYTWGKVDLIWFTSKIAAYPNTNDTPIHSLYKNDYKVLTQLLSSSKNIILFSHIPLRTDKTFRLGKWSNNRNLTIPLTDPLYHIINKYKENILAIFVGHIHRTYQDNYKGIPIFSFPLITHDSYCIIHQDNNSITISPKNTSITPSKVFLNQEFLYFKSF